MHPSHQTPVFAHECAEIGCRLVALTGNHRAYTQVVTTNDTQWAATLVAGLTGETTKAYAGLTMGPIRPASELSVRTWDISEFGIGVEKVALVAASIETLDQIDETWPAARRQTDVSTDWCWVKLGLKRSERYALIDLRDRRPLAVWCSKEPPTITLDGSIYYRLDYVEIHPELRGGPFGVFVFGAIAARALECNAVGVVLAAFAVPKLAESYLAKGATQGAPKGWNYHKTLLPFTFDEGALRRLKDGLDGFLEEEKT